VPCCRSASFRRRGEGVHRTVQQDVRHDVDERRDQPELPRPLNETEDADPDRQAEVGVVEDPLVEPVGGRSLAYFPTVTPSRAVRR